MSGLSAFLPVILPAPQLLSRPRSAQHRVGLSVGAAVEVADLLRFERTLQADPVHLARARLHVGLRAAAVCRGKPAVRRGVASPAEFASWRLP